MQYEVSAGGVIVKKQNDAWWVLLLKDKGGNWSFPKGLVEKGEKLESAAVREIGEEVRITKLTLITGLKPIHYFYKWEGKLKKKTVHYFLFETRENEVPKPQIEEGIMEVKWFPLTEAAIIAGYKKTNSKLLKEAKELLRGKGDGVNGK